MMRLNVYFDPATGQIIGHDDCERPQSVPGEHVELWTERIPDHAEDHIDLVTRTLRPKTANERYSAQLPRVSEVRSRRTDELYATDWRRGDPAWDDYRQRLRDVTKASDIAGMVESWPTRPDGSDAVPDLRTRVAPPTMAED